MQEAHALAVLARDAAARGATRRPRRRSCRRRGRRCPSGPGSRPWRGFYSRARRLPLLAMRILDPRRHRLPRARAHRRGARRGPRGHALQSRRNRRPTRACAASPAIATTMRRFARAARAGPWDAVIDTSGYLPQVVRKSAAALRGCDGPLPLRLVDLGLRGWPGFDEDVAVAARARSPARRDDARQVRRASRRRAKPSRAMSSAIARSSCGRGSSWARTTPRDRFTWWPHRVALGGAVAAPGRPGRTVQFIDVRDLARWMVELSRQSGRGTFNATGLAAPDRDVGPARGVPRRRAQRRALRMDRRSVPRGKQACSRGRKCRSGCPSRIRTPRDFMNVPDRARDSPRASRSANLRATVADTLAWSRGRSAGTRMESRARAAAERELLALDALSGLERRGPPLEEAPELHVRDRRLRHVVHDLPVGRREERVAAFGRHERAKRGDERRAAPPRRTSPGPPSTRRGAR